MVKGLFLDSDFFDPHSPPFFSTAHFCLQKHGKTKAPKPESTVFVGGLAPEMDEGAGFCKQKTWGLLCLMEGDRQANGVGQSYI